MSSLHAPSTRQRSVLALWQHSNLIRELVARDLRDRYSGSWLGMVWTLVTPIVFITIYAIVFGAVFGARIPGMEDKSGTFGFGVYLYSGLLVYTILAEVLSKSPTLVWSNPNYVKKVVFPLEILPVVVMVSAIVHSILPFAVLLVATYFILGSVPATAVFYPLAIVLALPMIQGLAWAIAALGAYVRDLGQVVSILVTVFMFMSPVFFPVAKFPPVVQPLVRLNPISVPVELANAALFASPLPPPGIVAGYAVASIVVFFLGWKVFQACRHGFADVI